MSWYIYLPSPPIQHVSAGGLNAVPKDNMLGSVSTEGDEKGEQPGISGQRLRAWMESLKWPESPTSTPSSSESLK